MGGSDSKESACSAGDLVRFLGQEDLLEKGMATHSSILAWRILPWRMDKGAWWATVQGVTKSWTQLSDQHFHFSEDIVLLCEKSASIRENDLEQFKQRR